MKISLVVPVLNEEDVIDVFYKTVRSDSFLSLHDVEIVFINDGSTDRTEDILEKISSADELVVFDSFTRNFGKEAALMAGINKSSGEVVIPIDVDLQDPIDIIPTMVDKYNAGADIVLAKRVNRDSDKFLKKITSLYFYKIHNMISNPRIEENVGDYRLISRPMVDEIMALPERNLFMKGVLSWFGGQVEIVEYKRPARFAGKTKFNCWKLWNLAVDGFTNFSTFPLRMWTYIGFFVALISMNYGLFLVFKTIFFGDIVRGYPSLIVCILFLGGIQLIGIGVLGEYIGRIYSETKMRPRYIIKKKKDSQ